MAKAKGFDKRLWWIIAAIVVLVMITIYSKSSPQLSAPGQGGSTAPPRLFPGDQCDPQDDECPYGCSCGYYQNYPDGYVNVCCSAPADTPCTLDSQCKSLVCLEGFCQDGYIPPGGCCYSDDDCNPSGQPHGQRCVPTSNTLCPRQRACSNFQ